MNKSAMRYLGWCFALLVLTSLLGCRFSNSHSKCDERRAQALARSVFDESEFTGNRYLRLVTGVPLAYGHAVVIDTDAPSTLEWIVPSSGYLVRLHEFPDRHEPHKMLRNIVCFLFLDKRTTNLLAETNICLEVSISGSVSNLEWCAF